MKNKITICLNEIDDIKKFAAIVTSFEQDIDIIKGSIVYDAKSILGVMLLGGSDPVEVEIYTDDENTIVAFHEAMKQFEVLS